MGWAVPKEGEKITTVDTLQGALHIITKKIRPLIQGQNTVPIRVKRNQLKQLDNVMLKLEKAVSEKGPNGEKSCSDMQTWELPSEKLRNLLLEEHDLAKRVPLWHMRNITSENVKTTIGTDEFTTST